MCDRQTGVFAAAKLRPQLIVWLARGLCVLLAAVSSLNAAESPARIESVRIGFREVVEVGRWTPISMQITGTPGTEITPRVTAADAEGRPVRQPGTPVVLGDKPTVVSMVYQHGPLDSPVIVELFQGQEILEAKTFHPGSAGSGLQTVSQLTDFVVCLGQPLLGFERAAQIAKEIRASRPDRVAPLLVQNYSAEQLTDLPPDARGWESVDACAISADCVIPDAVGVLLKKWVHQGGRLILIGGEQMASTSSPGLLSWLPVQSEGEMTLRDITALNRSIPGSATLRLREGSVRGVRWSVAAGSVLPPDNPIEPLLVRIGESLGTVTAIALDINDEPFARTSDERKGLVWESLPDLCRWLAGLPLIPKLEEGAERPQSDLNPTGVSDLQTQLVNTMDQFPEVVRPSYWAILGSALLFVLIVGPLDYLLVHRVFKKPHWTWATLPLWIALATAVGLSAAARTGGGDELIRQLDLVTWDASRQEAQLDSWLTIYSPQHHRYEVACVPGPIVSGTSAETQIRWAGRPEAGFRGLYRSNGIGAGAVVELATDATSMQALPVRNGASAVVEVKSRGDQAPPVMSDLLDNGDGHLEGTFSHQIDGELVDWVLAYGSFAYLPPRNDTGVETPLTSGQEVRAEKIPSRLLADYLVRMGTRSVLRQDRKSNDYSLVREAYDPLSRDLYSLLRTTTFYQIVGGESYTELTNSTLQNEDLSRLIGANRAVMFGRLRNSSYRDSEMPVEASAGAGESLAAQYTLDGKPVLPRYRECFVRWILPVKQPVRSGAGP